MAFRYRKSMKVAPGVRLNLSKSGVGVRVGGKAGGVSVHSSGRSARSVNLPGGLSWVDARGARRAAPQQRQRSEPTLHWVYEPGSYDARDFSGGDRLEVVGENRCQNELRYVADVFGRDSYFDTHAFLVPYEDGGVDAVVNGLRVGILGKKDATELHPLLVVAAQDSFVACRATMTTQRGMSPWAVSLFIDRSALRAVFDEAARGPRWAPDPSGRHELRYWNATRWTEHVSTAGEAATDPL